MTMLQSVDACLHSSAIVGLDAFFCPECGMSIRAGTSEYRQLFIDGQLKPKRNAHRNSPSQEILSPVQQKTEPNDKQIELIF